MARLPGFVGPSAQAQASIVNVERTVNLYPEIREKGSPKATTWLYATPGLATRQICGDGPHRGSYQQDGRAFVVSGIGFYEVFADRSSTLRGTVAAGLDTATFISNGRGGFQLLVTVGGYGYVFNLTTNVLTLIADPDFPQGKAVMCAFLDGYGIVLVKDSASFQISGLEDFTSWDALDIAQKSQTSDDLVSLVTDLDHKLIILFGTQTTERWWDSGAAAFPFEPVPNSINSQGCAAPFAVANPTDAVVWVSQNTDGARMAFADIGGKSERVSTHAVEAVWDTYTTVSDCIAINLDYRGHTWCVFQFPTANATWVFDLTEQAWFEWLEWDPSAGVFTAWLGITHMHAFDLHLFGSRTEGTLFALSETVLTDSSQPVRRLRRSPHISEDGQWVICSRLQFDFQVGVGLTSGQGSNPQIMLRISRDGGLTWGAERWASLGAIGTYLTRVIFWRNGRWRDGALELTITDPVVVALTDCYADLERAA